MGAGHSFGGGGPGQAVVDEYTFGIDVLNSAGAVVFSYEFENSLGDIDYTVSASDWDGPAPFSVKTGYDSAGSVFTFCEFTYEGDTVNGTITNSIVEGTVPLQSSNCDIKLAC